MSPIKEIQSAGLKWQRVKKYILSEVAAGRYAPGDSLPSEKYLCQQIGVARNTVRQAFEELEREGYIYRVHGKGTFLSQTDRSKTPTKARIVGLVVPWIHGHLYPVLVRGFDDELSTRNYQTLICQTNNDVGKQGNIILQLLYGQVDSVAVVPPTTQDTPAFQIESLVKAGVPVVACHRPIPGVKIPTVTWNRENVGRLAGRLFLEKGHQHIGYFSTGRYMMTEAHIRGLRREVEAAGLELPESHIVTVQEARTPESTAETENLKKQKVMELLQSAGRPTAILCNDDLGAEVVCFVAQRMGLRVPEDLSVVGFGNSQRDTVFRQAITSVVVDEYQLGRTASHILSEIKAGKRPIDDNETIIFDVSMYPGSTVCEPSV